MRPCAAFVVVLASTIAILGNPPRSLACTGEQPTFDEAVRDAAAIVRVVADEPPADSQLMSIVWVLKGTVHTPLLLDAPRTNLCGDRLTLDAGSEAIVAFDVPFYETSLTVAWMESGDPDLPVVGSAHPPRGAATLDDVEAAIVAELPTTAVSLDPPNVLPMFGWALLALALISGGRQLMRSSSSEATTRSAAVTSVSANCGTPITPRPAAFAAVTPDRESSSASASAGATPSRRQARR
jgi:hypothetical protein